MPRAVIKYNWYDSCFIICAYETTFRERERNKNKNFLFLLFTCEKLIIIGILINLFYYQYITDRTENIFRLINKIFYNHHQVAYIEINPYLV